MLGNVLFFGRKDCVYTKKIKSFLKKKSKNFYYLQSNFFGEKINISKFNKINFDYIFCFRSYYILKKEFLKKCKKAAINFHPGTPKYRGIGCVNFALLNNEKYYGCTAHIINQKIDSGKILNVKKFKVRINDNVQSCLEKTYKLMFKQAKITINLLLKNENNLARLIQKNKKIKWSKKITTKKDLEKIYLIKKNISKKDFSKRIRATKTKIFKPYISLYGKKFILYD